MPAWNELAINDLRGLMAYIQSLETRDEDEQTLTSAEKQQALTLFAKNCQTCHGANGAGQPNTATVLAPAPTVFREVRSSLKYAEEVLEHGAPGTSMPPWQGKLSAEERRLLARYLRSLYRADDEE